MKIIELIIDEENEDNGITAISLVEKPAIEENWVALKKTEEIKFAQVDKDKRILLGPALIPNKPIFRKGIEEDYYIFFSKDTVKKASELFFVKGNQNKSTLEHQLPLTGLTVVESWIVEDSKKDKTALYDMNLPVGSWMVSMRVDSDEIWNEYVKKGKVRGFSIEAYFSDKMERPKDKTLVEQAEANKLIETIKEILSKDE
tara:strand:+ start:8449 stop:9051 length:603 start_codon:yes stop_codon:yes gene_type:complete